MAKDKEREVRLQFLGEAQEYLNDLESGLLGLGTHGVDRKQIDGVLRAAHSIKGGAAMMGFQTLSDLAHRLEDFFKVLKSKGSQVVDEQLEGLFLASVDRLRQIAHQNRQGVEVEPVWLEEQVNPLMDALYDRLGDPQPEDALNLLSEDAEEDMVLLMFETEVEGCLKRLESVFNNPQQPCLREEFLIAAQELEGLGQMLDLGAFSSLCQSIAQEIEQAADDLEGVASLALKEWRRSHAMVMIGQREILPTQLNLPDLSPSADTSLNLELDSWDETFEDLDDSPLSFGFAASTASQSLFKDDEAQFADISLDTSATWELEVSEESEEIFLIPQESTEDAEDLFVTFPENNDHPSEDIPIFSSSTTEKEEETDTIRVPVKQLEVLGDMFGELTIERNGLNLQLKRLRRLIELLGDRVQTLEQSNLQLRNTYDRVTPHPQQTVASFVPQLALNSANTTLQDFDLLEMDRYNDLHLVSQDMMDTVVQLQEVTGDLRLNLEDTESSSRAFSRTSKLMQNTITQLRMRPISDLLGRFPRALRQLELQYGKKVNLKIKGGATLVDRAVLEALQDPLLHLFRNAFDHGIEPPSDRQKAGKSETGTIAISAAYRGNKTIITIQDDGSGINLDKIRAKTVQMGLDEADLKGASKQDLLDLIFEPGFSTAEQVTALSGRGVGMDVVRTNLRQIRGDIQVDTESGQGTTFTIMVPFTLSVVRVLLVESAGMLLAFPNSVIEEMIRFDPEMIMTSAAQSVLNWDGYMIPLITLKQWFDFARFPYLTPTEAIPVIDEPTVLMIDQGQNLVGIQVDRYWGEQEVTIRQVEGGLGMPPGFAGCTILGDGRVVPLVDVTDLLNWINRGQPQASNASELISTSKNLDEELRETNALTVMIVDDSINVRRFLALTLEKAGYRVEQARDGQEALDKLQGGLGSKVQLVISDIEMPRLDGYGLLSHLKSDLVCQKLPVIMLTSRSGDKHRQLAMNLGASAYFSKPFKETELLATLEQLIVNY
ncbi:MAG: hybrid sensor histidine kinase/response regulator [Cyanobacteria bacterium P01_G01_bin.49]